jgi:hypothetical protein
MAQSNRALVRWGRSHHAGHVTRAQSDNALCRYRYTVGIHLGIRGLGQNRKMTVSAGIEAMHP